MLWREMPPPFPSNLLDLTPVNKNIVDVQIFTVACRLHSEFITNGQSTLLLIVSYCVAFLILNKSVIDEVWNSWIRSNY